MTKVRIIALTTAVFGAAAALGSTILTPEQREIVLQFLAAVL